MNRFRYGIQVGIVLILVVVTLTPSILDRPKNNSKSVIQILNNETTLYKNIEQKKVKFEEPAQDAYIDKIWKKVPGRNGIKVNVDESYNKMKKNGAFNENHLIFEQVQPKVSLQHLQAAPIYRGHYEKEMVAILFYVLIGTEYIPHILNILKEHKVKATFFIEGKWANENKGFVKMIDEQGHAIGNHSYNHLNMSYLSRIEIEEQIKQTNRIIKAIIDKDLQWFAPPSGSYTDEVIEIANQLNMETVLWTVGVMDWRNLSDKIMLERIASKTHPGATILMYPNESTVQGLSPMLKQIKNQGYKTGTIDQLLSENR